jgi:NADH-quinone oxidoreductase subunit N
MTLLATTHYLPHPHIDWTAISPLVALLIGAIVVLMFGLLGDRAARERGVPVLSIIVLGITIALTIAHFDHDSVSAVAGAIRIDDLTLTLNLIVCVGGIAAVLFSWNSHAPREAAHGEYYALLLSSVAGMFLLTAAENTVVLWLGLELLSIPLYVLCAAELRREHSLESGLKYLIIGSAGSAVLLYGLAMLYGATGATDFNGIATAINNNGISNDPLLLTGVALCVVGLCFKASVAPFHQWTPDVYEGAPTPITAFMAVATKVAALGAFLRLFDVALIDVANVWQPAIAVIAAITIIVGNVGALGQSSMKRMLAYSSVAQAGYMLAGVVASTQLGVSSTAFYLAVYLFMNLAAFAVVIARERETDYGDRIEALTGIGRTRPFLAWPMTIAMLGLSGIPATAGFIGKFYLIDASVDSGYTWLGVFIVVGSMISLGYYLRVIAAMWMSEAPRPVALPSPLGGRPAMAGGSPELDAETGGDGRLADGTHPQPEVVFVALLAGAATIVFGIFPQPLLDLVGHAGAAFTGLF